MILWGLKPFLALALKGNAFIAALPGSRLWAGQPSLWAWLAWYLLVAVVFFRPLRKALFLPLVIFLAVGWMVRPSGPGVLIFDAGRDQATAIIYEDRSADLWYNKSRFSHPDQAAVVVIPALRANGIFTLRRCVVEGEERAYTEALFQKEFTFLKGAGTGDIPYSGVRAVPESFSDEPLLWEFRSLDGWDGKAFRPRLWRPSSMKDAVGTEPFLSGEKSPTVSAFPPTFRLGTDNCAWPAGGEGGAYLHLSRNIHEQH